MAEVLFMFFMLVWALTGVCVAHALDESRGEGRKDCRWFFIGMMWPFWIVPFALYHFVRTTP